MPAPKRGSSPDGTQPKIRKLDQDEDDLQSTTTPATNNTAADSRNIPAKSSIQSSPPKHSSKTISDPPVKKAKPLNATSASCGEALSQKANSNASLKRTASTESEDELSSDSGKTDPFRERYDGDKARCIRQYSNRFKAKRKAEESTSDPQETSQGSPSASDDPVQMEHNYGRFSDSSMEEINQEEKKESAPSVTELDVMSVNATQAESKESFVAGSAKASIDFECPADQMKREELKNVDGQKLNDNKAPASCRESLDSVTATAEGLVCITSEGGGNEKMDINNQTYIDNEIVVVAVETCCSTEEANPGSEVEEQVVERMNSADKSQTDVISETETKEASESVSKDKLDIKCKSKDEGQEASASADHIDVADKALSNETNVEGGVNPETKKNLTESVGNPDTQTDLSVKIQVTFKEESNIIHQVSHEVPDTITNSCEDVDKLARNSEEKLRDSERKGVEFLSTQTVAGPGSFAEHRSHEAIDKTTESCTEILTSNCEAVPEQNQSEVLSECVTDLEGRIDMETKIAEETVESAPKEDTLNREKNGGNDHVTQLPAVVEDTAETRIERENNYEEISNEAATMEIQIQKRQDASEHIPDVSTELNKDCVSNSEIMEIDANQNFECSSGPERQTTTASQILNPASSVEVQSQERPRDSERTADMSDKTQEHPVANCQEAKDEGRIDAESVGAAENRIEVEMQTIAAPEETSIIAPTVDMQSQEVTELTTAMSAKLHEDQEVENVGNPAPGVESIIEVDMQATSSEEIIDKAHALEIQSQNEVNIKAAATSMEISNIAETHAQVCQAVFEPVTDISEKALQTPEMNGNENKVTTVCVNQREIDLPTTTTREETSDPSTEAEAQNERGQEVNTLTTQVSVAKVFSEENKVITVCVDATDHRIEVDLQATTAVEFRINLLHWKHKARGAQRSMNSTLTKGI
ncbi:hypothetical protein PBY51_014164 [Eleginops maclovinus]|uniref:Uncharacterized protein n=1 Tax=Eleginops maclovinus TaxID=56733 RepID=A0AAN7WZ63_ELEMC|nr:hypothetical protein PBY51_014164 [Eleginops maclovinus]